MPANTKDIIKIINAVKRRECLWDLDSQVYAKRDKLEKAWQDVAQEVGIPDDICREKWRNVRTGFMRSIQSSSSHVNNKSEPGIQVVRRKRFYLYDHMEFLKKTVEKLEKARQRRKLLKGSRIFDDVFTESSNNTMQDYSLLENCEKHRQMNVEPTIIPHTDAAESETNYENILKGLVASPTQYNGLKTASQKASCKESNYTQPINSRLTGDHTNSSEKQLTYNQTLQTNQFEIGEIVDIEKNKSDWIDREETELLNFFRGNINDVLSLSKKKQRLFKLQMLQLINSLHNND